MIISTIASRLIYRFSKQTTNIKDFTLVSSINSPTRNLTLHQYLHNTTKAKVYHFQSTDAEQAYASIIKTYVTNNKGCPHILEHLACCGSHKFPIRDPFFNMIKRSVNSYMNAWTGDDFTAYPFSSANPRDWQNLYKVYLDMSLRPLLNRLDFLQEGWRYEINESGQKELKGIVLNEMKGAYQDSDRQLILAINQQLFRGTPYAFDTGGNPKEIASLEHSELKKMFEHYYHPSNMAFYYYGRGSISNHLQYLSNQYLNTYRDESSRYLNINLQPVSIKQKYKDIRTYTSECNNISINYLLGQIQNISAVQMAALRVIVYLLLDKANALLYKEFIESGIGQTLGFSGLNEGKITTFAFTIKGIYPEYQSQVFEQTFRKVIYSLIEKGIDQSRVKEYVHQFNVKLLTPQQNNGIRILEQSMFMMNHALDFSAYLDPTSSLNDAVLQLQNKVFVNELLNKFFLQNEQTIVVRQLLAEKQQQQEKIEHLVSLQPEQIKRDQEQLKTRQLQPQNAEILPKVTLSDLIKPQRLQPALVKSITKNNKCFQQYHVKINQNINFYRIVFNFQKVDELFLQKIMVWTHVLNNSISTTSLSYNQLASQLANTTSGFNVTTSLGYQNSLNVIFEFSCLKKNQIEAFSLLREMIMNPKFEKQHTLNVYKSFVNEWIESLVQSPMQECINEAGSHLNESGFINNSYQRIKDSFTLVKNKDLESLYAVSLSLHSCPKVILTQHSNQNASQMPTFISQLVEIAGKPMLGFQWNPTKMNSLSVIHNYSVNFCTQQYSGPKYLSTQHAHLNIILELLQQDYLHPKIRQQGGAYGSGARIRAANTISLFSYLDPNSEATFKVFDSSVEQLLSKDRISSQKLQEVRIMQLGEVDKPKVPQMQGVNQILKGFTTEDYNQYREALKCVTFLEAIETSRKYMLNSNKSRVIFGKDIPTAFRQEKLKDFLM